jgi:hypothetical protein
MPRPLLCCALLLLFGLAVTGPAAAQNITDYSLTATSGTFTPLTGATTPVLSGGSADDGWYNAIPIGFSFDFNGTAYTDIAATTNGAMFPGVTLSTSYLTNNLTTNTGRPIIAPLWDDLEMDLGTFSYKTEGSPGSQVFTAEWLNARWRYTAAAPVISFQVKLYEADDKIEFVYREESEPVNAGTASIGLAAVATGSGNFLSLTNTSASPGVSSTTETTTLSTKPATGQVYAFTRQLMSYTSSTVTQNSAIVAQGAVDAWIVGIQVVMDGALSPLNATSFTLNTTGTTSTANILNAKLYYTGVSPVFAPVNQFGSTVATPSGTYIITGTQALGSGTNYFWLAYDVAPGAAVGNLLDAQCTALIVDAVTRTPSVTAPAGARTVAAALSGSKTVGTGGDYATLTDAFDAVNVVGLGGNLTLNIISDLADTGVVINPWNETAPGGYNLLIQPTGAPRTINGNATTAVIKINGADRVTIDGRIGGTGNNLTIVNANTAATLSAIVWVSSPSAADSANDITVRNCNLQGSATSSQITGVTVSGAIGATAPSAGTNIVFRENVVTRVQNGIYMVGVSTTRFSTGNQVIGNTVGLPGAGNGFTVRAYQIVYQDGVLLEGNTAQYNVSTSGTMQGILLFECINSTVSKNRIHTMQYTGTGTTKVYGIIQGATLNATVSAPSNNTYVNNLVYNLTSSATSSLSNNSGIVANGGYGDKYWFNTVYMTGQQSGGTATGPSYAFSNGNPSSTATSDVLEIRNNIFAINGTATGAAKLYAHSTQRTTYAGFTLDNNLLYAAAGGSATAVLGRINAVDQPDLVSWQTASGEGAGSISADPGLNSPTNPQPLPGSPVLAAGVSIPGVTTDFAGVTRGATPSIGAYETAADVAGPAIVYTELTNTGSTANRTLTATITDFSTVAGGGNAPRLYFRKGTSGPYVFANATSVAGDDYTFTLDNSLIGGVTGGDVVQYYVAAQDAAGSPNASTVPAGGSGINPPGTTAPPAPASYTILLVVSSFPYTEDFEGPEPDMVWATSRGKYAGAPVVVSMPKYGEVPEPVTPEQEPADAASAVRAAFDVQADPASVYTESGGLGWYTGALGGGANNWVRGTPAKVYLNGANSGTKAYVTKETGDYDINHNGFVASPIFDFSALVADPVLEFYHKGLAEVGWDALVVEQSVDGGLTWLRVDSTLGTGPTYNTANSTYWNNSSSTLGPVPPPKFSDTTTDYSGNVNGWIKSTTLLLGTAGQSDVRLRWRFGSDGSVVREGWALDDVSIGSGAATVNVPIVAGWNMVSNPVTVTNDSVQVLYPTASFPYAFGFSAGAGYTQVYEMANGPGYWEKFPAATTQAISGGSRTSASVPVTAGWNMVGSLSAAFDTSLVGDPGSIRASVWFGYNAGYVTATQIEPGKAYWVKASAAGTFLFSTTGPAKVSAGAVDPLQEFSSVTITDATGASQTLRFGVAAGSEAALAMFAMPPVPPAGAFDARFATVDGGAQSVGHGTEASELAVLLQGAQAPVTLSWDIRNGAQYRLSDGAEGSLFATAVLTGKGETTIGVSGLRKLVISSSGSAELPAEFALDQNYPNPFNPSTTIRFALPVDSRVTLEVVNALGQRVAELASGPLSAGYHTAQWDGSLSGGRIAASGVYFARFSATGVDGRSFSDTRKLLLLK